MKSLKAHFALPLLVGGWLLSNPAQSALVSTNFSWTGDAGYSAKGTFIYDDSFALIDAEGIEYGDFNDGLDYLAISFYDSSNSLLHSAVNVQSGVVLYDWLDFTFNPSTHAFEGEFDMGSDTNTDGEYYINGEINGPSTLVKVNGTDLDGLAATSIKVGSVPLPGAISLFLTGILGLFGMSKCRRPGKPYAAAGTPV